MSDESVANALRSAARLVVIGAPAGCGKTFQGASYALDAAVGIGRGRVLVLTHTHAACDIFALRAQRGLQIEVRTIDGLIAELAAAYHRCLGLPPDPAAWARNQGNEGYKQLAEKAAVLLTGCRMIARAAAHRYPIVICDEHQDCSADQHAISMALHRAGALLRIFGDPMQRIYGGRSKGGAADAQRWLDLTQAADTYEELDVPHRWKKGSVALGEWILRARDTLTNGGRVDLRGTLPQGLSVIVADNEGQRFDVYALSKKVRRPIDDLVAASQPLLILAAHNPTVRALRAFFNRRLPIWEGHTRDALATLVAAIQEAKGDSLAIAKLLVTFLEEVTVGFSASAYSNEFLKEVEAGCIGSRKGKPATLQQLGRLLLDRPDHKGVADVLTRLVALIDSDVAFQPIKVDAQREFRDAVRLGEFDDCEEGLTELTRRRTFGRPTPPPKAISTIHKAKGLECDHVLVMPCDSRHFGDTEAGRCLLYVAMSRAVCSLTLVVSRSNPCPLLTI